MHPSLTGYLEWKRSSVAAPSFERYQRWVRRFIDFIGKSAEEITLNDIARYRNHLKDDCGYKPKNVQFAMSVLHDFLKYEISANGLNFPMHLFKVRNVRAESHYPITEEEHRDMMRALNPDSPVKLQYALMLSILHDTGIRIMELLDMQIEDLHPRGAYIKNRKNHESRVVFWGPDGTTTRYMNAYLRILNAMKIKEGPMFFSLRLGQERGALSARRVQAFIKQLADRAGCNPRICPHSYRHAFIHRKLRDGLTESVVAQMVGHISTNTIKHYSHLSSRELETVWGYPIDGAPFLKK